MLSAASSGRGKFQSAVDLQPSDNGTERELDQGQFEIVSEQSEQQDLAEIQ